MRLYFDSSAVVKLVQYEPESQALNRYLRLHRGDERVTSALARVEVLRTVLEGGPPAIGRARLILGRMHQISLDAGVLDVAATLAPGSRLRSLDAIHLATAQQIGPSLRPILTYDQPLAEVATRLGMAVEAPA